MDKPSGTTRQLVTRGAAEPNRFNFPGWINHPEPGVAPDLVHKQEGFNFPGWINHPERLESQGPDVILSFQLPRMDKPSGTRSRRAHCSGVSTSFNFPGWINHPEPLGAQVARVASIRWFQLPRMDKPSGTRGQGADDEWESPKFQLPRMDKPSGTALKAAILATATMVSTSPDG